MSDEKREKREKRKAMDGFGERLKRFRTTAGLTLRQVEGRTGLSEAYLSRLEAGRLNDLSVGTAIKLASLFDVSVQVMVGLDAEGRPVGDGGEADALFRDRIGREIEVLLGHEDRDRVAAFLVSLGLVTLDQVRDLDRSAETWRADSARLRLEAAQAARDLAALKLIADGLSGWAGRLSRFVDDCGRRIDFAAPAAERKEA